MKKADKIKLELVPMMAQRSLDHIKEIKRLERKMEELQCQMGTIRVAVKQSRRYITGKTCWECKWRIYKSGQCSRCAIDDALVNKVMTCAAFTVS